jgi:succinyl-CoA synthetase beta subunit
MRLLEYESKEILRKYGVPLPTGEVVSDAEGIQIQGPVVLKAQIPLGGRGKAGGIVEVSSKDEAKIKVKHLLSTEVRGYRAQKILVEEKMEVAQEFSWPSPMIRWPNPLWLSFRKRGVWT